MNSTLSKIPTLLGFASTTTSVFLVSHLVSLNIPITVPSVVIKEQIEVKYPQTTDTTSSKKTQEKPKQEKEDKKQSTTTLTGTFLAGGAYAVKTIESWIES